MSKLNFPLKQMGTISIAPDDLSKAEGLPLAQCPKVIGDIVYTSCGNNLRAYESLNWQLLWEMNGPPGSLGVRSINLDVDSEERVYIPISYKTALIESATGSFVWRSDRNLLNFSDQYLFTRDKTDFCCELKSNHTILWTFSDSDFKNRYSESTVSERSILLKSNKKIVALDISSGKAMWVVELMPLLKEKFADQYSKWKKIKKTSDEEMPYVFLGPFVNGDYIFGIAGMGLVAVKETDGTVNWIYEERDIVPTCRITNTDKLICFGVMRSKVEIKDINVFEGYLVAIDSTTGTLEFEMEKPFTERGFYNPTIHQNYFIAGNDNCLSVYDLEQRKYVWKYKYRKKIAIFGGGIGVLKDGLVAATPATNCLYWFR
jgi:outer membrane protein assembly factor BamB